MDKTHFRQLRQDYLREYQAQVYRELKDDGVLEAHLRHLQGRALAYYETLIAAGVCGKAAEVKVYQEMIAVQ